MSGEHEWRCWNDGLAWTADEHIRRLQMTGGRWRGSPGALDPWAQWVRENLPAARCGFLRAADDGSLFRSFNPKRPNNLGVTVKIEAKSHWNGGGLKAIDHKDVMSLKASVDAPVILRPLIITFDGGVPTPLHHWPEPCSCCGSPGPVPLPSTKVRVYRILKDGGESHDVLPSKLREWLFGYLGHPKELRR